jgi:hypothetical protein
VRLRDQGSRTASHWLPRKKPAGKPVIPAGLVGIKNIGTVWDWEPDRFHREPAEPVPFPTVRGTLFVIEQLLAENGRVFYACAIKKMV